MRKFYFLRFLLGYITIIIVLASTVFFSLSPFIQSQFIKNKIEELLILSSTLQNQTKSLLEKKNWLDLESLTKNISNQTGIRISVILPDGEVVADTFKDPLEIESHINRPEVKAALKGETIHWLRYSTTTKEDMLYLAAPILIEGDIKAVVRFSVFLNEMNHILNRLKNKIIIIAIVMILISIVIAYLISNSISRKFKILSDDLIQGLRKLNKGNFETRILHSFKEPEINELVIEFNSAAEKLKQNVQELSQQSEELISTISYIPSGLALINDKGKIILNNQSFVKTFSSYSYKVKDKYFWEILREKELNQKINELIEKKKNFDHEHELLGKVYLIKGAKLDKTDNSVLIFYDISDSKRIEHLKKNLVANISHELRTPLTAIKGYIETFEEVGTEEREKYLPIIKRNIERIINMVNDLLFLSKLEDKDGKIHIEKVDLGEIVFNVHKTFLLSLKGKNLRFNVNIPLDLPKIEADEFQIEQMFINLIDNAIKFTEKGEINVSMELTPEQRIKIEIADTGIGLKQEELNRIFERFYVVNKARSRKAGGTGLGLSIVKHIVMLHKGEIKVDSRLGVGSKFIITLPIQQS